MLSEGPKFIVPKEALLQQTHVRLLEERDMPAVSTILDYWFIDYQKKIGRPTAEDEVEQYLQDITAPNSRFFVADIKGQARGVFGYTTNLDDRLQVLAQLHGLVNPVWYRLLFLNEEVRGKNVGRELITTVFIDAIDSDHPDGLLYTHERWEKTSWGLYDGHPDTFQNIDTIPLHEQDCRIYTVKPANFIRPQLLKAA